MSSIISETKNINENNPEDLREETENGSLVSTHIYLKPTPSTGTLEKKVVLRRIRHRKCMNKVRAAVKAPRWLSLHRQSRQGLSPPGKMGGRCFCRAP
ncbi:hypothetical protein Acr_05g0005610 [Actinidia rufa]|uniref:Uncharacterized protein n=1 Tax=Actinidia rufa TaxID=165716 RepID=A0A7J0EKU6_9ERIC|nr:hypothetical protein Acr_05g0005610 [Actinidia rufa]